MIPKKILLGHGSGGRLMHALIKDLVLKKLNNPFLRELSDASVLPCKEKIAFTTDSFVVTPLFFPGGDIGKLSVCGTINDLVMLGAVPQYLSLALILEEGLDYELLESVINSIAAHSKKAKVACVTGDIKVVEKGSCDKIFITTSGIGRIVRKRGLSVTNIRAGDKVIVTGEIGQHGIAVLSKRKELDLGFNVTSDCASLNGLLMPLVEDLEGLRFMRDPTRGGVATTLNEIAQPARLGIVIQEQKVPISGKVRAACELLGIDPFYVANEGRAVIVAAEGSVPQALRLLRKHPLGKNSQVIGEVVNKHQGQVALQTSLGATRLLDMLTSEPLPRIC
jgi:hydrogenase expression/formation protein HypE